VGNFSYAPGDVPGIELISEKFALENKEGNEAEVASGDAVTASVTFEVTQNEPLEVHLGSWERPGPWLKEDIPWGPRYDMANESFEAGEHTISVSLAKL